MNTVVINRTKIRRGLLAKIEPLEKRALSDVLVGVDEARDRAIEKINDHEITQEILGQQESENFSGTLGGKGNLWGFIGFHFNSKPISKLLDVFRKSIKMKSKTPTVSINGTRINFKFRVYVPSLKQIYEATPMPWAESGRSWVEGISEGIGGLSHFLYHRKFKGSRSLAGIQSKNTVREEDFSPEEYIKPILEELKEELRK